MFLRRRRPLLGAAMIGGTAYMAGKAGQRAAQREAVSTEQEADQEARLRDLEAQTAPAAQPDLASKLTQLKGLLDQGALTPEEFDAAKAKLLAG